MPYRGYDKSVEDLSGLDLSVQHPDQVQAKPAESEPRYLSITISAECSTCDAVTDNAEGDGWTTNPEYTEYQCPGCQERLKPAPAEVDPEGLIDVHWEGVTVNETVVFSDDDLVIARVPIEAVRMAAITLTELIVHIPAASITLNPNETYSLTLTYRQDYREFVVSLIDEESTIWRGDLEDIDPF